VVKRPENLPKQLPQLAPGDGEIVVGIGVEAGGIGGLVDGIDDAVEGVSKHRVDIDRLCELFQRLADYAFEGGVEGVVGFRPRRIFASAHCFAPVASVAAGCF